MYWELAKEIIDRQNQTEWGESIIDQLSIDLRLSFPDIKRFSRRNLYAIRQWYLFYSPGSAIVPQPVAQIPWGTIDSSLIRSRTLKKLIFIFTQPFKMDIAEITFAIAIKNIYFESKGKSITNFQDTFSQAQSDLAIEILKNL